MESLKASSGCRLNVQTDAITLLVYKPVSEAKVVAPVLSVLFILELVAALPPPEWQSRMVWLMESSPEPSTTYP
jgi:hypothetical protein